MSSKLLLEPGSFSRGASFHEFPSGMEFELDHLTILYHLKQAVHHGYLQPCCLVDLLCPQPGGPGIHFLISSSLFDGTLSALVGGQFNKVEFQPIMWALFQLLQRALWPLATIWWGNFLEKMSFDGVGKNSRKVGGQ